MGFLRRLMGRSSEAPKVLAWPPPGPITTWPAKDHSFGGEIQVELLDPPADGGTVEVAGESAHQGTLQALARGFGVNGPVVRDHKAVLLPEPDNPYDPNAIKVVIYASDQPWGTVGYLGRTDAVAYRPIVDRLAALGWLVGCRASLKGGQLRDSGGRNFIGVTLYLDTPKAIMADVDAEPPPPSWEPG